MSTQLPVAVSLGGVGCPDPGTVLKSRMVAVALRERPIQIVTVSGYDKVYLPRIFEAGERKDGVWTWRNTMWAGDGGPREEARREARQIAELYSIPFILGVYRGQPVTIAQYELCRSLKAWRAV